MDDEYVGKYEIFYKPEVLKYPTFILARYFKFLEIFSVLCWLEVAEAANNFLD